MAKNAELQAGAKHVPVPFDKNIISSIVINGDISKLSPQQKVDYYRAFCERLGLDPISQPFKLLRLNGKELLYCDRSGAQQLNKLHKVSHDITGRETVGGCYVVTARASLPDGRHTDSIGAVTIDNLRGEALCNAMMKSECCPLNSEILTRQGWKFHDELNIGEDVLAYDCATDTCKWTPLQEVSVFQNAVTVRFGTSLHGFRCTPNHKWAVENAPYIQRGTTPKGAYSNRKPGRMLVEAKEISTAQKIILAAPAEGGTLDLAPDQAAILGWVFTDGTVKREGAHVRLGICQSKPDSTERIADLLTRSGLPHSVHTGKPTTRTFPGATHVSECLPQTWFYLNAATSRDLLAKAGITDSRDLPAMVTRLTKASRAAMLEAMLDADADKKGRFGKKRKPGVMDAYQILATLEGCALGKMGLSSVGDVPIQQMRKQRYMAGSNVVLNEPEREDVWCPTTQYGTWVMRQNGNVVITGNTKAKRRATLDLLGLGILDESETDSIPNAVPLPAPAVAKPAEAPKEMRFYKKKYDSAADLAKLVAEATDVKDLANLYCVNAELVESDPQLKQAFREKKMELFGNAMPA